MLFCAETWFDVHNGLVDERNRSEASAEGMICFDFFVDCDWIVKT